MLSKNNPRPILEWKTDRATIKSNQMCLQWCKINKIESNNEIKKSKCKSKNQNANKITSNNKIKLLYLQ